MFAPKSVLEMRGIGLFASLRRFLTFYVRCVSLELSAVGRAHFQLTFGRILILGMLLFGIPYLMVFNHMGMLLDEVFFPSWRSIEIHSPLFIVGNARSGTTFLHRLIQQADGDRMFTTFRTWEIIFAVSITWKVLFHGLYWIDQSLLGTLGLSLYDNVIDRLEKSLIGDVQVHAIGLQEPEEDEWLMAHIGLSQLIMFLFPLGGAQVRALYCMGLALSCPIIFIIQEPLHLDIILKHHSTSPQTSTHHQLNPLVYFDSDAPNEPGATALAQEIKRDIFTYYRECVQRHLYFHKNKRMQFPAPITGGGSTGLTELFFISKNPPFTTRLASLAHTFPSAKVAVCIRDPVQSVPSMVSYISMAWQSFACPVQACEQMGSCTPDCHCSILRPFNPIIILISTLYFFRDASILYRNTPTLRTWCRSAWQPTDTPASGLQAWAQIGLPWLAQ